jgi:hypothetical protein
LKELCTDYLYLGLLGTSTVGCAFSILAPSSLSSAAVATVVAPEVVAGATATAAALFTGTWLASSEQIITS